MSATAGQSEGPVVSHRIRSSAVVVLAIISTLSSSAGPAVHWVGAESGPGWLVPVDGPIIDGFRPPASRYSAGNRGVEFALPSGSPVRAVDAGRVVFAGAVGSSNHVTIDHGNGLRSTAAYVESILVVRGQRVGRGQVIATAGPGFHLTARLGAVYVDPALLFDGAEVVLALIEGDPPNGSRASGPTAARRDWGGLDLVPALNLTADLVSFPDIVGRSAEAAERWRAQECEANESSAIGVMEAGGSGAQETSIRLADAGTGHVLIQVGGLGSSSSEASIGSLDTAALGYDPADVVGFSYLGGCTPRPFGTDPALAASAEPGGLTATLGGTPYDPDATLADLDVAAGHLADLVESAAAARPGQPIDIVAHSLGGVVTGRALEILQTRPGGQLPATIVTIGSPHQGVNLADAAIAARPGSAAERALERVGPVAERWDALSVSQVATSGPEALPPPGPPPDGVHVVAIGAAVDPIVPLSASAWEGAVNVAVPGGVDDIAVIHSELPGLQLVETEVGRAVSGEPSVCRSLGSHVASVFQSAAIQRAEDLVTLGVGVLSLFD